MFFLSVDARKIRQRDRCRSRRNVVRSQKGNNATGSGLRRECSSTAIIGTAAVQVRPGTQISACVSSMTILDLLSRKSLRILILWLWQSRSIVGLYGIPILQFPESASVKPRIPIVPVIQQSLKISPALHPACFVRSCANCLLPGSTTMPESARSQFLRSLNSQQVTQVRGRRGPEAGFK